MSVQMETSKAILELNQIQKVIGRRTIIDDLSLVVSEGERFFIVGPSGCGKTTLLRIIAGLDDSHEGTVTIDGRSMVRKGVFVPPHLREVGFMFQDGALWPHLTVDQHIYYSRNARHNREWTERILDITGLAARRNDYPHMLSGGELQRIALARALSRRPRLLLLDEPLRNIDANLAREMRVAIVEILDELSITSIFVTHDQEEALSTADRILLMNRSGRIQLGTPDEVYNDPATPWAFRFFGTANVFEGRADSGGAMETVLGPIDTGLTPDTACAAFFRPAQIVIVPKSEGTPAKVIGRTLLGDVTRLTVDVDGTKLHAACCGEAPAVGATIGLKTGSPPIVFENNKAAGTQSDRKSHVD